MNISVRQCSFNGLWVIHAQQYGKNPKHIYPKGGKCEFNIENEAINEAKRIYTGEVDGIDWVTGETINLNPA